MNGIHGILMMATGALHILFGFSPLVYRNDWLMFFKKKFLNQVELESDRSMAAFWFVMAGPLFVLLGSLIYYVEINQWPLPIAFGWLLLAFSTFGSIMSHKSGFTFLLLPQAVFYLMSAY